MGIIDLDELALQCRDPLASSFIQEAVAAYKAGAMRSCIVSTWNAVVFDFLHKLRELDLAGDKNASLKLRDFESIRAGGENKLKEALEFERSVIDLAAKDFELLTPVEQVDLSRLQQDRNRCAHPSMQSAEEPYQPTAELARCHLRNAVQYLLSREPVQGKAAFDRIVAEVKSPYFPREVNEAKKHFETGPLARARKPLVASLVKGICKSLLKDNLPSDERSRQLAAVGAMLEMHRGWVEEVIINDLPGVMASVEPADLWKLVVLFEACPLAWDQADYAVKGRVERYLLDVSETRARAVTLAAALGVPHLRKQALGRLEDVGIAELGDLIAVRRDPVLVPLAIDGFGGAASFRDAEGRMERLIIPFVGDFSAADVESVLTAASDNGQIWDAARVRKLMATLFDRTRRHVAATTKAWQSYRAAMEKHGVWNSYGELAEAMTAAGV